MSHENNFLKIPSCEELFDLEHTVARELLLRFEYPWEALAKLGEFILSLGSSLSESEYEHKGEGVWVSHSADVCESALICGPAIIGAGTEIRHNAYIRGSVIVGKGAVVGNSTELKNCIIFDGAQIPHYNYIGDSILGYKAHMGAGSIASNMRSDKASVRIKNGDEEIATSLRKLGVMLGDFAEVGCNAVLCPGSIVGRGAQIYPLARVRGTVGENCIYKDDGNIVRRD